jgi:hypothetical protein
MSFAAAVVDQMIVAEAEKRGNRDFLRLFII